MTPGSFEEIRSQIQKLYHQAKYRAALDLATKHAGLFPEHAPLFNYWRLCMMARLGDTVKSLYLLEEL